MSDLSNSLRSMKFMQRTGDPRKKSVKKPSTTLQSAPSLPPSTPLIITPDHPGCWRIITNTLTSSSSPVPLSNPNHPAITYCNSVFSIHDRQYTRLSFQNYNKRIEPLMIKYGLKQDTNPLEDGEIDPDDDDDDDNAETRKKPTDDETEPKHVSTLGKTIRKKFEKKPFARPRFDNKSRVTKRKRRTRPRTATD